MATPDTHTSRIATLLALHATGNRTDVDDPQDYDYTRCTSGHYASKVFSS